MSSPSNPVDSPPETSPEPGPEPGPGPEPAPITTRQAIVRDLAGLVVGIVVWTGVLSISWMQGILETSPFLLWPLIPLVVLLSGLISMIAIRNRFLVADISWVVGLMISGGLGSELIAIGLGPAIRVLLYTGAWYALLYAPLVMTGIWMVDRLRGKDA